MMDRRRALMMQSGESGLPSIYQQVESIYANNGPYIQTDYLCNPNTEIYVDFTMFSGVAYQALFGFISSNGNNYSRFQMLRNGGTTYTSRGNTESTQTGTFTLGTRCQLHCYPTNNWDFSGTVKMGGDNDFSKATVLPLAIFGTRRLDGVLTERRAKAYLYSFSIEENDDVKLNLIPCYRKSDGVIGMYDTVSKTFLTNSGSGSFTKGNDVT